MSLRTILNPRSVRRQLVFGIAVIQCIIMSLLVYDLVQRQESFMSARARQRGEVQAHTLAADAAEELSKPEPQSAALKELIDPFTHDDTIKAAYLLDTESRFVAHTDPKLIGTKERVVSDTPIAMELAAPIVAADGRLLGISHVTRDLTAQRSHLAYVTRAGTRYVLVALILGTLFTILLVGAVTRQLGHLMAGAKRLVAGDLTQPVPVTTTNELGNLATTLNIAQTELSRQRLTTQRSLVEAEEALRRATAAESAQATALAAEQAARAEAERLSRLKDEFLATVSHELRTPLNVIMGHSELLRMEPHGELDMPDMRQSFDAIYRNARAQGQIIDDLLDVSRIISGKLKLVALPVDLATILQEAIESVGLATNAKGVSVTLRADNGLGPVSGDASRLRQVAWNLLNNAVKFTARGGHIDVALERRLNRAELIVRDTGVGIDPNFLPYVFERFRQEDGAKSRRFGGLGLGLSIVRYIVEAHGGTATVESEGKGKGTTVRVLFPLMAVRLPGYGASSSLDFGSALEPSRTALNGVRVLIIDDEADSRQLVAAVLARYGAEVCKAVSARDGFDAVQSYRPDVILCDIGLPEESGHELIRRVRALPENRGGNTPAVALTAYAADADKNEALAAGFQMHLAKPVEMEALLAAVQKLAALAKERRASVEMSSQGVEL